MYVIKKNGEQVDQVENFYDACRVAEAFEEFYPDSRVEVRRMK